MQVGLAEMQTAVEQTGGLLVQASTFNAQAFKESFRRIFAPPTEEGHLGMNSNAQFEVSVLFNKALISFWRCWLSCVQAHCPFSSQVCDCLGHNLAASHRVLPVYNCKSDPSTKPFKDYQGNVLHLKTMCICNTPCPQQSIRRVQYGS